MLELKGFLRVPLEPGESRRLTFVLPVGQLGFYDRDLSYVVEPGTIEVFVGTSSAELTAAGTVMIEDDATAAPEKAFDGLVTVEPVRS